MPHAQAFAASFRQLPLGSWGLGVEDFFQQLGFDSQHVITFVNPHIIITATTSWGFTREGPIWEHPYVQEDTS